MGDFAEKQSLHSIYFVRPSRFVFFSKVLLIYDLLLGTGKTTTLVEAIIQLVRLKQSNKVLVCTPSNTAADHITLSLLKLGVLDKTAIFRLYSLSRSPEDVNSALEDVVWAV